MSDQDDKRDEILAAVEKSEARLQGKSEPEVLADRSPPEKVGDLIREHPGLVIAAGVGIGLVAAMLLPKGPGRKLLRRGGLLATAVTEMALVFGQQAIARASEAAEGGRDLLGEQVGDAARRAGEAGRAATRNVKRMASETSTSVREKGSDLAKKAGKTISRLRD